MDHLSKYLHAQQQAFEQNFSLIGDHSEAEAIHDFRVSIKKLRALFLLMEFISPGRFHFNHAFSPFQKIFKKLGPARDLQVQQSLIPEFEEQLHESLAEYSDFLHQMESSERLKIDQWISKYNPPEWNEYFEMIATIVEMSGLSFTIHKANLYIQNKIDEIRKLLPTHDIRTLHHIRRLLKEIRYMIDCLVDFSDHQFYHPTLQKNIKLIEDDLGDWHDRVVANEFLHIFFEKNRVLMKKDQEKWERFNDLIRRDKLIFLDQAKHKLERILIHEQYFD